MPFFKFEVSELSGKRRNELDVMADILEVARGGANKTRVVYKANLNFKLFRDYFERLSKLGFLEEVDGLVKTTSKGFVFLSRYRGLCDVLG